MLRQILQGGAFWGGVDMAATIREAFGFAGAVSASSAVLQPCPVVNSCSLFEQAGSVPLQTSTAPGTPCPAGDRGELSRSLLLTVLLCLVPPQPAPECQAAVGSRETEASSGDSAIKSPAKLLTPGAKKLSGAQSRSVPVCRQEPAGCCGKPPGSCGLRDAD